MIHQSIARRYAKGLFAVGEKDGKYREYYKEIEGVLELFQKEARLGRILMLPIVEIGMRKEILADVLKTIGASVQFSNMVRMLLEKNRMAYLSFIRDQYSELIDEKEGRVRGTLWSAFPVDDGMKSRIEEALGKRIKKDVVLRTVQDKGLIGGVKVDIKGTIIDGSVKRQLETLKENILKE